MENIVTRLFRRPDSPRTTISVDVDMTTAMVNYQFLNRVVDALAEKAVKEMWKRHGAAILKKVDKKTIGNLTVKKLSTLIAQELKVPTPKD